MNKKYQFNLTRKQIEAINSALVEYCIDLEESENRHTLKRAAYAMSLSMRFWRQLNKIKKEHNE